MHLLLKSLPLLTALLATPVLAAEPKSHADHQPAAAAAKPDAKGPMPGCPMMSGQMAMNSDRTAPPKTMPQGKAAPGPMMKGGEMHCMQTAGAKPQDSDPTAAPEHDHDHPAK